MSQHTAIACSVPYGKGGLGQHFSQVVDEAIARGEQVQCFSSGPTPPDKASTVVIRDRVGPYRIRYTPMRFDPAAINHYENERFDRAVASQLTQPADTFVAFGGQALRSFRHAKAIGTPRLVLVAANSHVKNVARLHAAAITAYPMGQSWLNQAQVRKTLDEYELADTILIASQYSWETFVREGVPEHKLHRVYYATAPRFQPPADRVHDGVFRVVFLGSVSAMKGVPLLIEAFSHLDDADAELILVGGTGTRGMNKYITQAIRRDPRIRLAPGDPVPHLHRASVCVHPSYEDNLAYAGIEALACGLPVIASADTGMKEYIREGINGYVVPTGNWQAILDRLRSIRRNPLVPPEPFFVPDPREQVAAS